MTSESIPGPRELTMVEEIFPTDSNSYGTLFGGKMVALMDMCAGLCASRFAKRDFVTVSVDSIFFRRPVKVGQVVEVFSRVVFTTEHTVAVKVESRVSNKEEWKGEIACEGLFFFVAKDPEDRILPIPQYCPENDDQKAEWEEAQTVREEMLDRFREG